MKKLTGLKWFIGGTLIALIGFSACKSKKLAIGNADGTKTTETTETILEKRWKLVEIMGKPVAPGSTQKEPYIRLVAEGKRLEGTGGCNGFGGTYELKENNRIHFSQIIGTQMACENMRVEQQLIQALQTADSYYAKGDTLQLIRARMAPLARFEAVYLQ